MLLKKSATNDEHAIFDYSQTFSRINILRSALFLNQYCSETPLKIFFQQHRPDSDIGCLAGCNSRSHYLLTNPSQFDILQFGPGGQGTDAGTGGLND
jgi:hypothetical protein